MSYFLAESEKKRVKLVSVVDGVEVSAEGTLREVTIDRHNAIYKLLEEFRSMQDEFDDLGTLQVKLEREFAEGKVTQEEFTAQIEKYSDMIKRVIDVVPSLHKKTAEIVIKFDKEAPSLDFYGNGFEYTYLVKLRNFFLNVQKNLNPL